MPAKNPREYGRKRHANGYFRAYRQRPKAKAWYRRYRKSEGYKKSRAKYRRSERYKFLDRRRRWLKKYGVDVASITIQFIFENARRIDGDWLDDYPS